MERIGHSGQKSDPCFRRKQSYLDHTLRGSSILLCCALFACIPLGLEAREDAWDKPVHDMVAEELSGGMQPSPREEAPAAVRITPSARRDFSLHVAGAPAMEVIRTLAEMTGKNLVFQEI